MFKALMNATRDSVVFKDLEGRYAEVSIKKAMNWGLTPEEMRGKTDFHFMSLEEANRSREDSMSVIKTGVAIENSIREALRNEKTVYYSLSEYPWYNDLGILIGTISVSRDITDLVESKQEAVSMTKQVIEMLTIVSHDLSSPLISIDCGILKIMRGFHGKINKGVYKKLNDLHKRLLKQRGAILDYLHKFIVLGDDPCMENELLDVRVDIIEEVLEELEEYINENGSLIDFSFGLIPPGAVIIHSSKAWLKITYRNLIMNALKHGGKGCIISFGFENRGDRFWLNVYNNGPAVPEDEIAGLFERFVQGKNVQKRDGLGIGLYTIRKMIQLLGGEMWYETTLSKHPNFIFSVLKK